ncbi:hypothetical protein WCLP8_4820002 [uncultured Gammaproteobacteria bacterium]
MLHKLTITQQGSTVVISDGIRTVRSYYATDQMAKRMASTLQKRSKIAERWLQVGPNTAAHDADR